MPELEGLDTRVALVVSEIAANAIVHARTRFAVSVLVDPAYVRVEVTDDHPHVPVPQGYATDSLSGRGLAIVDHLSDRWGAERRDRQKLVWFEIDLPRSDER